MVLDEQARPASSRGSLRPLDARSVLRRPPRARRAPPPRSFQFNGNAGAGVDQYANFEYGLVRAADDLQPTRYYGKGAARCFEEAADVLIVWSMGRE